MTWTNSADTDQTASEEAVRSESSLFAILTSILLIPAMITNFLVEKKRESKSFKILEHFWFNPLPHRDAF